MRYIYFNAFNYFHQSLQMNVIQLRS